MLTWVTSRQLRLSNALSLQSFNDRGKYFYYQRPRRICHVRGNLCRSLSRRRSIIGVKCPTRRHEKRRQGKFAVGINGCAPYRVTRSEAAVPANWISRPQPKWACATRHRRLQLIRHGFRQFLDYSPLLFASANGRTGFPLRFHFRPQNHRHFLSVIYVLIRCCSIDYPAWLNGADNSTLKVSGGRIAFWTSTLKLLFSLLLLACFVAAC